MGKNKLMILMVGILVILLLIIIGLMVRLRGLEEQFYPKDKLLTPKACNYVLVW